MTRPRSPPPPAKRRRLEKLFLHAQQAQQAGRYREAEKAYRKFLEAAPGHPVARHFLGLALYQQGRNQAALRELEPLAQLLPKDPGYWSNFGLVLAAVGRAEEAVSAAWRAVSLNDRFAGGWYNLGVFAEQSGKVKEATAAYQRCLGLQPEHLAARYNLGMLLREHGRYLEAEDLYREGLALREEFPGYLEGLIDCLYNLGRAREADESFLRLQQSSVNYEGGHLALARIYWMRGEGEQARSEYMAHLEQDPGSLSALAGLCQTKRINEDDRSLVERLESALEHPHSAREKKCAYFTLGKAYADLKEYDEAFSHYQEGNRLMAQEVSYSSARHEQRVDSIIRLFDTQFNDHHSATGNPTSRPIFIVGMPRSGTTLVEQILAAHPEVAAGGELPYIPEIRHQLVRESIPEQPFPDSLRQLSGDRIGELAEEYLEWINPIEPQAARITDKMPFNYRWIGLIHLMFPRAAIIHCRRDPVDTCLSCYFQDFSARIDFAWRLEDLAHYYGLYRRMMAHWEAVLPGRILHLDYEALVSDPEPQVRRLLEYCGLEWDDACLRFHEVERPVLTASTWQVRQPLYTSSVKRWKRYEKHLGPLLEGLKPWLEDEPVAS